MQTFSDKFGTIIPRSHCAYNISGKYKHLFTLPFSKRHLNVKKVLQILSLTKLIVTKFWSKVKDFDRDACNGTLVSIAL